MAKFIQIGDTVLNVDNISHFSLRSTSRVLDVYLNASPLKPFTYRGERASVVYEKLLAATQPEKWDVPQEPRPAPDSPRHEPPRFSDRPRDLRRIEPGRSGHSR